jgi:hypothetical protein
MRMTDRLAMDQYEGSGRFLPSFEEIDQRYHLKMRAFVRLVLPPIFFDLEKRFALSSLRQRGIWPIMFNLTFENSDVPLILNKPARVDHRVRLRKSVTPQPQGAPLERLLLEMEAQIFAARGSGDPARHGAEDVGHPEVPVGRLSGYQVFTRPVAPPGQRQVTDAPEELAELKVHPFDKPFPVPEHLAQVPPGFAPAPEGPFPHLDTVWGLPNTDVNQHVNVQEYVMGMENHVARRLHGAGLPQARHRIARTETVFRKPFFAGEGVRIQGPLLVSGARTLVIGGYHRLDAKGVPEARPSAAVRMEGILDGHGE